MSSGFNFGAMGICVICFDNDKTTPGGSLFVDDNGDTWNVCNNCHNKENEMRQNA